jgi:hypothetical protein
MDIRTTIEAKSDQLNAIDLIGGARTIKITKVVGHENSDQPISIHFEGDNNKPFKPCKSVRRMLVELWGHESDNYVGRLMTLFMDKSVKWAGVEVGGIRVSHVSHIDKPTNVLVTVARGSRRPYEVLPLVIDTTKQKKDFKGEGFESALKSVQEGKHEAAAIQEQYNLTDEQLEKLNQAELTFKSTQHDK